MQFITPGIQCPCGFFARTSKKCCPKTPNGPSLISMMSSPPHRRSWEALAMQASTTDGSSKDDDALSAVETSPWEHRSSLKENKRVISKSQNLI